MKHVGMASFYVGNLYVNRRRRRRRRENLLTFEKKESSGLSFVSLDFETSTKWVVGNFVVGSSKKKKCAVAFIFSSFWTFLFLRLKK